MKYKVVCVSQQHTLVYNNVVSFSYLLLMSLSGKKANCNFDFTSVRTHVFFFLTISSHIRYVYSLGTVLWKTDF